MVSTQIVGDIFVILHYVDSLFLFLNLLFVCFLVLGGGQEFS